MLVWQLLFFLAPLLFLIALSFWPVRNFRMEPDFNPDNWIADARPRRLLGAYLRTCALGGARPS